jgi:SNF2 family DNA or RNA helicase
MLRRLQRDSSVTLPPLRHQDVVLRIKGQQANLYESVRATTVEGVREVLDAGSISGAQKGRILGILTQLRQVCTDPRLTSLGRARSITESAKFSWIQENLPRLVSEGRRVLVVCFFSEFFDLLGPWLRQQSITFSMIRSGVTDRERQKEAFKEGRAQVFLLGLKSGGRGLDLPEADVVLHLDPWWNPQAHAQATARAHRMGQTKSVLVMRLLIEGSLEERVLEIQDRKRQFASALDDVTLLDESKISEDDIRTMLLPMRDVEE